MTNGSCGQFSKLIALLTSDNVLLVLHCVLESGSVLISDEFVVVCLSFRKVSVYLRTIEFLISSLWELITKSLDCRMHFTTANATVSYGRIPPFDYITRR